MQRILLVDDEPAIVEVLSIILQDVGYEVLTASNGSQALGMMVAWKPHLILSDWMMPRMGGAEFLSQLKAMDALRNIPVIAMTATPPSVELPLAGILQKPFPASAMLDMVGRCLCVDRSPSLPDGGS